MDDDSAISDLDFLLPSWGDEPEPEPEVRPGAQSVRSRSPPNSSRARTLGQLEPASSRQETVEDMRARLRRMEARARLRSSPPASPGLLDESRITAGAGSPLHSLQTRAQLGGFSAAALSARSSSSAAGDGSPLIGERLLAQLGDPTLAGGGHATVSTAGAAVDRAREERSGRRRWLSDRLWHTASIASAAALMGLDSPTEAALLRLRAAAAGGNMEAMQFAVDDADAVVARSYDRPHSVTDEEMNVLDGTIGGGGQGMAELTACLHDVKLRMETYERQRTMLLEAEAAAGDADGGGVAWELTQDEAESGGGDGAAARALQARFSSLGWAAASPVGGSIRSVGAGSPGRGGRGDEI